MPCTYEGNPTLPLIHRDETLYSWCAAAHLMDGSRMASHTGLKLLGTLHAVRQHDIPASLRNLPLLRKANASDALEVLRRHTICGYYLPFMSLQEQEKVGERAISGESQHWRRMASGVSRTRPLSHPLKWCDRCATSDFENGGRAYWHTEHQFPTTWVCPWHQVPLLAEHKRSKQWRLPPLAAYGPIVASCREMRVLAILAEIGCTLNQVGSVHTDGLRAFALNRLFQMGVIHSSSRVRHERLIQWFLNLEVASICMNERFGLGAFGSGEWIPALLWRKKLNHSVRWILLWSALDWSSAAEAASAFLSASAVETPSVSDQLPLFERLGSTSTTAPKKVYEAFDCCDSYAEVMKRLEVGRSDVVRWLEMDEGLRIRWRQRLKEGREAVCIDRVTKTVLASPDISRTQLESLCSAEIRWLRDHAPERLRQLLKSLPSRGGPQRGLFDRL